ncbi:hypothetical protein [Nocardia sp. NPDC051570]|uniref:hypothetical protein n=1 Tax=Nocardia sp. NPDC051570 TaxID=3364324 RepID=UPI0037B3919C
MTNNLTRNRPPPHARRADHAGPDNQAALIDTPTAQLADALDRSLVRAFHRQRWTGGMLAVNVFTGSVVPSHLIEVSAHWGTYPLGLCLILDLGIGSAKYVREWWRDLDVIIIRYRRSPRPASW